MTVVPFSTLSRIRKINVRHDLMAIADLIEVCFASTLDDDGREYLRQLRWTSRDSTYLSWLQGAAERIASPLYGFVWEENDRIVGNLSLIPMNRGGQLTYLIANVAVHPDYRRRGIARNLTQAAIDHLRQRGIANAWLQVRDDNPAAYHLYLSLGFIERSRRTTWLSAGSLLSPQLMPEAVTVRHRRVHDWEKQSEWLRRTYPPEVIWNLPLSISRLSPDPLTQVMRWLRGESQETWAVMKNQSPIGFATWEPMRASSDALWLALDPFQEEEALLALLPHARRALARHIRPLSVNYPAGRASQAFHRAGFIHHQTLIWMTINLNL